MEIEKNLKKLCSLLADPQIKGKQTAFDFCYQELEEVKQYSSWSVIVDVIEKQSGIAINPVSASTMYRRARNKKRKNSHVENIKIPVEKEVDKQEKMAISDNQSGNKESAIEQWKSAGIKNEYIINQCIDNNVALELALSWKCPNDIMLSNKVTEHIMKNKG